MKAPEFMAILFFQAWWNDLTGDEASSNDCQAQALSLYYTGFPFPQSMNN